MNPLIIKWLAEHWKGMAFMLIFLVILGSFWYLNHEIEVAKKEALKWEQDYKKLDVEYSKLKGTTEFQNQQVEMLKNNGQQLQQNMNQVVNALASQRGMTNAGIQGILTAQVPQDCKGAVQWAVKKAIDLNREWKVTK